MTNEEHIELVDETLALASNMLHDLEPNGINRIKIMSLLNSAMYLKDTPPDNLERTIELLKLKIERNTSYYMSNKINN